MVLLNTKEQKEKLIRPDFRAFGLLIDNNLCKIEDADYKVSVNLYNLPYGVKVQEILHFLNKEIADKCDASITLKTDRESMKKLLIKFS